MDNIKLYSFNEALEKLKNKEISKLIRAKYMVADFQNKCILLYRTEKYVELCGSCIDGKPDCLWQTVKSGQTSSYACISSYAYIGSDDILAEDYIDTTQWTLCETREKYDEYRKNI